MVRGFSLYTDSMNIEIPAGFTAYYKRYGSQHDPDRIVVTLCFADNPVHSVTFETPEEIEATGYYLQEYLYEDDLNRIVAAMFSSLFERFAR